MKTRCLALICIVVVVHFTASAQQWKEFSDSAKHYLTQKKPDKAIDFFLNAKALLRPDSLHSNTYVQLCKSLSLAYFNLGQRDKAEPVLLEALAILEKLNKTNDPDYALFNDMLGQKYFNTDPQKAEAYFITAKNVREIIPGSSSAEFAQSCNNLGALYNNNGSWNKALQLHLKAKAIREKLSPPDSLALAQSCNNLGDLYRITGQFELAEPNCEKAKALREIFYLRNPNTYGRFYAISCVNLANLYRDMGQYKKAEPLYVEAKNVREKVFTKQNTDYAASCDILATLYHTMGQNQKAEELFIEAKTFREGIAPAKQSLPYAESVDNLASLYRNTGRYKEAEEKVLEAKAIWEKALDPTDPALAINYNNVGLLYSAMRNYKEAELYFLNAKKVWQKIASSKHPSYTANSNNLATIYWNTKRIQKANDLFTESFSTQYDQLINFFQFTGEKEKQQYIQNISGSGDQYYSFCYQSGLINGSQAYNVSLLNRSLILNASQELRNIIYQSNDTALHNMYEEWITGKQQLANVYSRQIYLGSKEVSNLEGRSDLLEKELTKLTSFTQKRESKAAAWKSIQQTLKPNEAAIEFIEFTYFNGHKWTDSTFYIALLLKKNNPYPQLIKLFEKKQLENIISLKGKNSKDIAIAFYANNQNIYNLVWRPLEKSLQGINKIYFAPAGALHRISLAALPLTNKQLLSDKYQLVQLNTTASVTEQITSSITAADKIVLYGGVEYSVDSADLKKEASVYHTSYSSSRSLPDDLSRGEKWNLLPGSQKEITQIAQLGAQKQFHVNSLQGIHATEESIEELKGKASPAILHIATHGFFYPDPKQDNLSAKFATSGKAFKQSDNPLFRSGLLLAGANLAWENKPVKGIDDGILTAYEVSNLYLPNTKLVVLSACETALGDIQGSEGVYGLQRAFKMAGAENLIMSLWKVPDVETAEFMQEFYKHLFNSQTINDAFYKAQTTMKNKYRNEPYIWAAWILVR